jgi:soluble lytic murein transglycosylase-like protein
MRPLSCNRAAAAERRGARWRAAGLVALAALLGSAPPAVADRQLDPGLRAVVQEAIDVERCASDHDRFDQEVFYKLQEPRLRPIVRDRDMRLDILRNVYCESNFVVDRYRRERHVELKLTPELVLAVIDVESRFNRYAVSSAGAVGLMQVMPFWPRQLGVQNRLFGNGSPGRREYPDTVLTRLTSRWRG